MKIIRFLHPLYDSKAIGHILKNVQRKPSVFILIRLYYHDEDENGK